MYHKGSSGAPRPSAKEGVVLFCLPCQFFFLLIYKIWGSLGPRAPSLDLPLGRYSQHSLLGLSSSLLHFMLLSFLCWLLSLCIEQNNQINKNLIFPLKKKCSTVESY